MENVTAKPAGRFVAGDPRGASGRAKMTAIATENRAEIESLVAELLETLGPSATIADRIHAELIAAATVRSRRKRGRGQDDRAERREIARLLHAGPFQRAALGKAPQSVMP